MWNLSSPPLSTQTPSVTQTHYIQTIAPATRVKWRPKRSTQIASVVNSFDLGVNVWELSRPSIPFATFTEHRDVVTSKSTFKVLASLLHETGQTIYIMHMLVMTHWLWSAQKICFDSYIICKRLSDPTAWVKNRNYSFVTEGVGIFPGIIWKDHHEFISGGKDSKLVMHHFKDAVRLCEKVNPISLSVNVNDQLALAINEKLQMSSVQQTGMT